MGKPRVALALAAALALLLSCSDVLVVKAQDTERIEGSAGDVLEDDPVGRLKVYVYELPTKYNKKMVAKDSRCLSHMFAAEIFMHRFLLSSAIRTMNPEVSPVLRHAARPRQQEQRGLPPHRTKPVPGGARWGRPPSSSIHPLFSCRRLPVRPPSLPRNVRPRPRAVGTQEADGRGRRQASLSLNDRAAGDLDLVVLSCTVSVHGSTVMLGPLLNEAAPKRARAASLAAAAAEEMETRMTCRVTAPPICRLSAPNFLLFSALSHPLPH